MARRIKGEGSLYQAKDKSWVCQYYAEDGSRRTKRFRHKTDGRAFLDSLRQDAGLSAIPTVSRPATTASSGLTVGEWLDRWLEKYARPTVKLSTYCS